MSVREEAVKLYNEGLNFAKQERYTEAIQPLLKSVEIDPNYVNAYSLLGKIHIQDGDVKRAREYWLKALKIDPYNATASACLEASYPKPLLGGVRSIARLATFLIVVALIIYVLFQLKTLANKTEVIVNKTEVIEGKTKEIEQVIEEKSAQVIESQVAVTGQQNATTNVTAPKVADQAIEGLDKGSEQIAPKFAAESTPAERKSDVPNTKEDLVEKYNQAQELRANGKYTEALAAFSILTQTSVSHRYIIGNSYFWIGICYKTLGQPAEALESLKKVTAQNSYKAVETKNEIKALQRKLKK
ncbi:TPA: tetratricopeptide repeat protein [Candidatus Poribacteria bacterium]|nr:tetratricopeptide repeat protein [Candidatus Poribacteria bacterium]HIA66288.1 tetratricopeptide repeat protein [Candidatus Poribacteria bacterium]HIB91544.1 tetratricopeptide repeat protein [Candidatus Poribacteria bacterium]HIC01968.1 tetratricopeptide repeat protein [Candidatus Poribacteria bacterium]HIN27607.1 tetratricopeptide repeat protein [Candidatus Poribacteria bacterium]